MLCENCGKNVATVHYEQIINGVRTEKHLCAECAEKLEMGNMFFEPGNFFAPLFSDKVRRTARVCKNCGCTEREFLDTQFVGCPECYETFADLIEPMVQRIHGSTKHKAAKIASNDTRDELNETDKLKKELQDAVDKQEYEKAAKLRDRIKELENGNK